MKHTIKFFIICGFIGIPALSHAATCSRANLTRCLDSVCAINVSSNPAARCQYCGTASAGTAPTDTGMRSLSVGQSAKYTIGAKELKSAPTDPGARYTWATTQCIKKVDGCTPDDVTDTYDTLIEQSCKAAGISAQMDALHAAAKKKPTKSACNTDIKSCVIADKKCGADYSNCKDDADFNKFFSECSVSASGCDDHIATIRSELLASRDNAVKNASTAIAMIVAGYQNQRESRLNAARATCKDDAGRESCIERVCANTMRNGCAPEFPAEKSMAIQLCKFFDIACATLR